CRHWQLSDEVPVDLPTRRLVREHNGFRRGGFVRKASLKLHHFVLAIWSTRQRLGLGDAFQSSRRYFAQRFPNRRDGRSPTRLRHLRFEKSASSSPAVIPTLSIYQTDPSIR